MKRITFQRITLNISKKQHKAFHQLAQEDELPYSELIRRALDEYLERRMQDVSSNQNKSTE